MARVIHRQGRPDHEATRPAATDLLVAFSQCTAEVCFSHAMAHGVLSTAEQLGLRVPRDLSVVGLDDTLPGRPHRSTDIVRAIDYAWFTSGR